MGISRNNSVGAKDKVAEKKEELVEEKPKSKYERLSRAFFFVNIVVKTFSTNMHCNLQGFLRKNGSYSHLEIRENISFAKKLCNIMSISQKKVF